MHWSFSQEIGMLEKVALNIETYKVKEEAIFQDILLVESQVNYTGQTS